MYIYYLYIHGSAEVYQEQLLCVNSCGRSQVILRFFEAVSSLPGGEGAKARAKAPVWGCQGCLTVGFCFCWVWVVLGLLGYWVVGLLLPLAVGLLGCWAVGLLGCWAVGLLGCWAVGLLGCWAVGRRVRLGAQRVAHGPKKQWRLS